MEAIAHHSTAPVRIIRDQRGGIIGRLEEQHSTGRTIARDARGVLVGTYDFRQGTNGDARGIVVAQNDTLAALLFRR